MHVFNVFTLYWQSIKIAPSKAVVGVDRPIMALSMHIQKPYKGIIVKVLIAVILSFFLTKLHHACGQCDLIV